LTLNKHSDYTYTVYHIKDETLTYSISGVTEAQSTTSATTADLAKINSIISKYKLDTLQSDEPPPPGVSIYSLTITKDKKIYNTLISSSKNTAYALVEELEQLFNQIRNRAEKQ
jgi:hypothetical protein